MKLLLACLLCLAVFLSYIAAENDGPARYKLEPARTRRAAPARRSRAGVAGAGGGAWGGWGPWSACSRSCGGGVAVQARECRPEGTHLRSRRGRGRKRRVPTLSVVEVPAIVANAPADNAPAPPTNPPPPPPLAPALATKRCEGLDKRYHECNTKPCPGPEVDKRAEQCAAFDSRPFKGRFYSWLPYVDAESPCTLNCRPSGQQFYASLVLVEDGTECTRPGYRAICVHGECKVVGRDGVLAAGTGGGTVAVCGSRLVSGLFSRPALPLGYSLIATVPAGACRLNVSELQPSENYIALKVTNGSFVINGDFALSAAGAYEAAGARFVYARGGGTESVYAAGPLLHSVDIMILYKDPKPSIKYEYLTSAETTQADASVGTPAPAPAPAHRPRHQHVPNVAHEPDTRDNTIAGSADIYSWKMIGFTPCSRTCGGGVQTSRYRCESSRGTLAPAELCSPKPAPRLRRRRCGSAPCAGGVRWRAGPWSTPCPECGPHQRTRQVVCIQEHNKQVTKISEHKCTEKKPHLSEKCPVPDCGNATTTVTPAAVEVGDDRRRLRPRGRDTEDFRDAPRGPVLTRDRNSSRAASPAAAPGPRNRKFNQAETSNDVSTSSARDVTSAAGQTGSAEWLSTDWSQQCTSQCGRGVQTRAVSCASRATTSGSLSGPPASCSASSRPPSARSCASDARCDLHQWFTGPWSPCSSPCGSSGRQTRAVLCVSGGGATSTLAATSACARDPRPAADRPCVSQPPCEPAWYTGEWTECSGSCGAAQESRVVRCALEGGATARDRLCVEPRPATRRACNPIHCRQQNEQRPGQEPNDTGPGGARSTDVQEDQSAAVDSSCVDRFSSCSLAVQARLCQYNYYRTACCRSCAAPHPYKISEVN